MSDLIDYLIRKKDDRGIMADLKCGLIESKKYRAYPYIGYFGGIDSKDADVVRTIAGLFAYHSVLTNTGNMGDLCRKLCGKDEDLDKGPIAKRFQYLLASNREEICDRVTRIILRAGREGIPVNYVGLYDDLKRWNDRVKTKWAASFWNGKQEDSDVPPDQN